MTQHACHPDLKPPNPKRGKISEDVAKSLIELLAFKADATYDDAEQRLGDFARKIYGKDELTDLNPWQARGVQTLIDAGDLTIPSRHGELQ